MNLLIKLEDFINKLILLLQEQLAKVVPTPVKKAWNKVAGFFAFLIAWLKKSPFLLKDLAFKLIPLIKAPLSIDYKGKLIGSYQQALEKYKQNGPEQKTGKFKKIILAPILVLGQWMSGLSPVQSLVLLIFTALSFVSLGGMLLSGQRLARLHLDIDRAPASVEEEISYERPQYYKKQNRFLDVTNVRLPVYFVGVNEIRSVDIDFTATLSNRQTRQVLEKLEFQLRDHLVLQVEPVVSSFPLEEEGKEIIRQKLKAEINEFLKLKNINGEVVEMKITYILAN